MDLQKTNDDPATGQPDSPPQKIARSPRPKRVEPLTPMEGVDLEAGDAEYQELLEMYDQSLRTLAEGEVVRGRVLRVSSNEVILHTRLRCDR